MSTDSPSAGRSLADRIASPARSVSAMSNQSLPKRGGWTLSNTHKTRKCKAIWNGSICPYGYGCTFIHPGDPEAAGLTPPPTPSRGVSQSRNFNRPVDSGYGNRGRHPPPAPSSYDRTSSDERRGLLGGRVPPPPPPPAAVHGDRGASGVYTRRRSASPRRRAPSPPPPPRQPERLSPVQRRSTPRRDEERRRSDVLARPPSPRCNDPKAKHDRPAPTLAPPAPVAAAPAAATSAPAASGAAAAAAPALDLSGVDLTALLKTVAAIPAAPGAAPAPSSSASRTDELMVNLIDGRIRLRSLEQELLDAEKHRYALERLHAASANAAGTVSDRFNDDLRAADFNIRDLKERRRIEMTKLDKIVHVIVERLEAGGARSAASSSDLKSLESSLSALKERLLAIESADRDRKRHREDGDEGGAISEKRAGQRPAVEGVSSVDVDETSAKITALDTRLDEWAGLYNTALEQFRQDLGLHASTINAHTQMLQAKPPLSAGGLPPDLASAIISLVRKDHVGPLMELREALAAIHTRTQQETELEDEVRELRRQRAADAQAIGELRNALAEQMKEIQALKKARVDAELQSPPSPLQQPLVNCVSGTEMADAATALLSPVGVLEQAVSTGDFSQGDEALAPPPSPPVQPVAANSTSPPADAPADAASAPDTPQVQQPEPEQRLSLYPRPLPDEQPSVQQPQALVEQPQRSVEVEQSQLSV